MIQEHPDFQKAVRALHDEIITTIAPHVLVVDDNEDDVIILRHALVEEFPHIQVDWKPDAASAVEALRVFKFDLVLLDLQLGRGCSGAEAFTSIRQFSPVPVAGLTGLGERAAAVQEAMAAGLDIIFRKPLSQATIRVLFGKCI